MVAKIVRMSKDRFMDSKNHGIVEPRNRGFAERLMDGILNG
jgi:hypothetical protein